VPPVRPKRSRSDNKVLVALVVLVLLGAALSYVLGATLLMP
jgi:hypothetical protein